MLSPVQIMGAVLVLGAAVIVQLRPRSERTDADDAAAEQRLAPAG
jgi:hypothetical protein